VLTHDTFDGTAAGIVGKHMTRAAADEVYTQSGLAAEDVDVIELHDCFSANELITYEALGLCAEGEAGRLVDDDDTTYGGRWVVNPSGGLISKGHPLGATGLCHRAPVAEGEFDPFSPANISPLVAYLATEKCPHNGKVFGVQGGSIQELLGWHMGRTIETDGPWTIEDIADRTADWS
jgi:hypothetical protein